MLTEPSMSRRPQRGLLRFISACLFFYLLPITDGPALRATTLITYANWLVKNGNTSYVTSTLWPIIKLDLDYVSSNWNNTGYVFPPLSTSWDIF